MHILKTHTFATSPVHGGNFLRGDIIKIDADTVTLHRGYYFSRSNYSISIPLTSVVYIEINEYKLGAEILIQSFSKNYICSKGYSIASARRIKQLIQQ